MDYFAGLDVSLKETSVCIVDDASKIVREARVASEPEARAQRETAALRDFDPAYDRSGSKASEMIGTM